MIKIVSWNVNGVRALSKSGSLATYLRGADVMCIQETRLARSSDEVLRVQGYETFGRASARSGHAGVATLTRIQPTRSQLDVIEADPDGGRSVLVEFPRLAVLNVYVPHGSRDRSRLGLKLRFLAELAEFVSSWIGPPLALVGDFNVARSELDLARARHNHANTMFSPVEREAFDRLLGTGLIDSFREKHPSKIEYTWWPYAYEARQRNVGWRIDYALVSTSLRDAIVASEVDQGQLGSDHCPVILDLCEELFP